MRVLKALAALCFVALGIVFGALNREHVQINLALAQVEGRLGFVLLAVLLLGALIGGIAVMAGVVWPMRRKQRSTRVGSARSSGPVTAEFPALREPPR